MEAIKNPAKPKQPIVAINATVDCGIVLINHIDRNMNNPFNTFDYMHRTFFRQLIKDINDYRILIYTAKFSSFFQIGVLPK